MARMASIESQFFNWEASGWAQRSFLVCFWKDVIAAWKIASKLEEAAAVADV